MNERARKREEEARAALARVKQDSVGAFDSAMAKAADHFGARDATKEGLGDDRIEIWGRRIGRALGAAFLLILVANYFTGWFF